MQSNSRRRVLCRWACRCGARRVSWTRGRRRTVSWARLYTSAAWLRWYPAMVHSSGGERWACFKLTSPITAPHPRWPNQQLLSAPITYDQSPPAPITNAHSLTARSPITNHPNNQWNRRSPTGRSPITARLDDQWQIANCCLFTSQFLAWSFFRLSSDAHQ
jgi:hypothetical protein